MCHAQSPPNSKVYFTGLGRALITHDKLDGNILQNDTATPNRGTEGYALFDMGVNLQPFDYVRGKVIIRLKNKFGSFYGQGASVEFRQLLIEGIIAKKVKYALGDIDVLMTPYTVFNSVDSSEAFESDLFKTRREIVHYENLNVGNNWRVQGAKANTTMRIKNTPVRIRFDLFGSRTRAFSYTGLPDRFLTGGAMNITANNLKLGGNYVRFFELADQTRNKVTSYSNDVVTGTLAYEKEISQFVFRVKGEGGKSLYQRSVSLDSSSNKNDFFFDLRGEVEIKPIKLRTYGGYREIGPEFYSPSAQTVRIDASKPPSIFPRVGNDQVARTQLLYDRFTQEGMYNQTILPTFMLFLPQFGNALPYGDATPNRKGVLAGIVAGDNQSLIKASIRSDFLSEIIGEGTTSPRQFMLVRGGASMQLNQVLKFKRVFTLTAGGRWEQTDRSAPAGVSLQTQQVDVGLTFEALRQLDLILGYKALYSKGNEFLAVRNSFNDIVDYSVTHLDLAQQTISGGIRYRFTNKSFFTVHGNFTSTKDLLNEGQSDYLLSQYFVTYTLGF